MPQSLSQVIIHIVFSTKDRRRFIDDAIRDRLHAFLAEVCRARDCNAFRVGGTDDHVHIIATLGRTISQSKLIEDLKRESSKWIKEVNRKYSGFYWQRGYGVFSLGQSQLRRAEEYVANQVEHHHRASFVDEFRSLLAKYGIEYDEQYVWD
jgi:putative transposase